MVVPLAMGLSKHHKFSIITDNIGKDKDKTPPPFIVAQLGKERLEIYAFIDPEQMVTPSCMSCLES